MKKILLPLLLFSLAAGAWAQSAEDVDRLLASEAVNYAAAARFVLLAAEVVAEDAEVVDPAAGFALAVERGWLKAGLDPEAPVSLGEFSNLCVAAFKLKTGYMYRFVPGPRYAYRELVYQKLIQGRSDPAQAVPGTRVVSILGRILDTREAAL
jgi:hypothetical protein